MLFVQLIFQYKYKIFYDQCVEGDFEFLVLVDICFNVYYYVFRYECCCVEVEVVYVEEYFLLFVFFWIEFVELVGF